MDILDGSYFVFNFYADYTEENSALALLQLKKGSLEEILHPCDSAPSFWIGEPETQEVINYLLEKKISKVYSLRNSGLFEIPNKLFGFPINYYRNDEDWHHYDGIYDEHYWCSRFEEEGIQLEKYIPKD